jgi:hypothetical protein
MELDLQDGEKKKQTINLLILYSPPLPISISHKVRKGVTVFNNAIKQKNNTYLDLGFSPNGMMLRLNF